MHFHVLHYHRHYVKLTAILWDLLWDCSAWVNSEREFTWQLLHSDLCAAMWRLGQWIPARAQHRKLHSTMHARLHWSALYLIGTECIACIYYIKKRKLKKDHCVNDNKQVFCTSLYSQLWYIGGDFSINCTDISVNPKSQHNNLQNSKYR